MGDLTQMPRLFSPRPLLPQADSLVRQSKTFLIRSVGTGIIAPFDSKRFAIVGALNAAPLGWGIGYVPCTLCGVDLPITPRCLLAP